MLINEAGLLRNIKHAYKRKGYTVGIRDNAVIIYTEYWFVKCKRSSLPRKVLAAIVEHMGMIPEGSLFSVVQGKDPQMVMEEMGDQDMYHWRCGERGGSVTVVPVIMQNHQIFQEPGGGECWGVPLLYLEMLNLTAVENYTAGVVDQDRLLWDIPDEALVISAVRKAGNMRWKTWERAVWEALEGVDLHNEDS